MTLTSPLYCFARGDQAKKQVQDTRGQLFNSSLNSSISPSPEQFPNLKYRRENDEPNTHDRYSKHIFEERLYLHIYRSARMRIWQYRITQENRHAGDAYRISRISVQLHQIPARETSSRAHRNIVALIYRQRSGRTINQPRLIRDNRMHAIDCCASRKQLASLRSLRIFFWNFHEERKELLGKKEKEIELSFLVRSIYRRRRAARREK